VDRDSGVAGFPTSAARVGIGTDSPAGKLHVVDAAGGDGSVRLPASSISSAETLDEAGVGFDSLPTPSAVNVASTSTSSGVLASRSVSCPGPGYVLVVATVNTTTGFLSGNGEFDFSVNRSLSSHNARNRQQITVREGFDNNVTVQGMFQVTAAGSQTFYFLGTRASSSQPTALAYYPRLSVIFVPSAYGTVDLD
jgi:hypothetical protein